MALSTTPTPPHAPPQAVTPHVGMQGAQPKGTPPEPIKPVLFEDIDPVLLMRLYPELSGNKEAREAALAAGIATHEAGAKMIAAQQEPVLVEGAPPAAPAAAPTKPAAH
jgi:hypothetical protein